MHFEYNIYKKANVKISPSHTPYEMTIAVIFEKIVAIFEKKQPSLRNGSHL